MTSSMRSGSRRRRSHERLLAPKAIADAHLGACVDHILPGMGALMWLGVTLFGGLWYVRSMIRYLKRTA
jgi:hypothetical protein